MRVACLTVGLAIAGLVGITERAEAQMFGPRTLGGNLRPGVGPGQSEAGTLTGNERFIRGNRDLSDFVGADRGDLGRFVGQESGRVQGPLRSAIDVLQPPPDRNINRPPPETTTGRAARRSPYRPRYRLDFALPTSGPSLGSPELAARVQDSLARAGAQWGRSSAAAEPRQLVVRLEGRTAILEGEVASERHRALAERLLLLEPGISSVRNELTVATGAPEAAFD